MTNYIKRNIAIYTDGSCLKNGAADGGLGGYSAILIDNFSVSERKNVTKSDLKLNENFFFTSGYQKNTTNNQMELRGAIAGIGLFIIKFLKNIENNINNIDFENLHQFLIEIHVDSQYVKNGINDWIHNWKKNNWRTAARTPVKNQDLWVELDKLNVLVKPSWHWVKGHSDNILNDLTDHIANTAATNQMIVCEKEILNFNI